MRLLPRALRRRAGQFAQIKFNAQDVAGPDPCAFIGLDFLEGAIDVPADGEQEFLAHVRRGNIAGGLGDFGHGLQLCIAAQFHAGDIEIKFL